MIPRLSWELSLTKHCAGLGDLGHWCVCTYTYLWPNPSLSVFVFPLVSLTCLFLWFIIIFAFDSLTACLMLIIGYIREICDL